MTQRYIIHLDWQMVSLDIEGDTVAVTGGAGYIGSVLSRELLNSGLKVVVLDNFRYDQSSLLNCCADRNFSLIRGDVRNRNVLESAIKGADYIIHLAALVGAPICEFDSVSAITTNIESTKLLISLRKPGQKILFPCTNSGYGIGQMDTYCTEDTPLRPISLYGKTKVEAEKLLLESGNVISYRLATVFGASTRMRTDLLINNFVYRAVTDRYLTLFEGHFKRNYIHIKDVARAFIHGISNFDRLKTQVYNVGLSKANLSKLELCEKIKEHLPSFLYLESKVSEDVDKRNYIVSNEKIEKTGFNPVYSIDDGIEELIKVYSIIKNDKYSNI